MKRFIVETVTKDKLYILLEYLRRGFEKEELEPFKIEEVDTKPLKDSTHIFFIVEDVNKGIMYELEISDFAVYMKNYDYFDLKFKLSEFCLVMDYHRHSVFDLYLQSKNEDEDGFKQVIFIFTSSDMIYNEKNINMRRLNAYFEFFADKTETID